MHSDVDLLVVTRADLAEHERDELLNETYPLFLECGRQLSPHFVSAERLDAPRSGREREFLESVRREWVPVWSP